VTADCLNSEAVVARQREGERFHGHELVFLFEIPLQIANKLGISKKKVFAICTSVFSKLCKKTYTVACRRVFSSAPL
jgi:hypothetical protein